MCRQDVDNDIFTENPYNDNGYGYKREKAENMRTMLCNNGKIIILHNKDDMALNFSYYQNWGTNRLGWAPSPTVRPDFKDIVVDYDMKPFTDKSSKDDWKKHSFHWEPYSVEIYEKYCNI